MRTMVLLGALACSSFAQSPDLIRIVREGEIQPYIAGRSTVDVVGMSAVSGAAESWLIELHNSFASIEAIDQALNPPGGPGGPGNVGPTSGDDVLPPSRTWIARHHPELSYRPEQAIQNLARARYLDVVVYRIPPGAEADFAKVQKLREFSLDSINSDRPDIAYEVVSGAPSGTYLSLTPLLSLASLDEGRRAAPVYAEGVAASARKLASTMGLQRERLWFRMEPRLSYVSEGFAAPDPGFWHPAAK